MRTDTVIFISNPFGFGPAGKAIILMQELRRKWGGKIVYIASQKCLSVLPEELRKSIEVIEVDERNDVILSNILSGLTSAMVVVVLNRAAVRTARSLGMKTFFVDSLAWMWKETPIEYLSADTYYYYDVFGSQEQLNSASNARPIPPILGLLPKKQVVPGNLLIHIGGFSNPFAKDNHSYLRLIGILIDEIDYKYAVTIAGGKSSMDFLIQNCLRRETKFVTAERNIFLEILAQTDRFVTTSGSTAVFEAFAMSTQTTFLPPTNLSQWKQLHQLIALDTAPLHMLWEKYLDVPNNLKDLSEQDALEIFVSLSEKALGDPKVLQQMQEDFLTLLFSVSTFENQSELISNTADGASLIISDILKVVVIVEG